MKQLKMLPLTSFPGSLYLSQQLCSPGQKQEPSVLCPRYPSISRPSTVLSKLPEGSLLPAELDLFKVLISAEMNGSL